eukprot:1217613-Rhodomonas_salina.1
MIGVDSRCSTRQGAGRRAGRRARDTVLSSIGCTSCTPADTVVGWLWHCHSARPRDNWGWRRRTT